MNLELYRFSDYAFGLLYLFLLPVGAVWCPYIEESSRIDCGAINEAKCTEKGCCWEPRARIQCYERSCRPGTFGFGCRFNCSCSNRQVCDPFTGECPQGCPVGRWGVGCMLEDGCTYNDGFAVHYLGRQSVTDSGHLCQPWKNQGAYSGSSFADGNLQDASNFCRNPEPTDFKAWCFYRLGETQKDRDFDFCTLLACECALGRWGINCAHECHCSDSQEYCNKRSGECSSGCALGWTGRDCQECQDGFFGPLCEHQCHCDDDDICDKVTGRCHYGCAPGWQGPSCLQECRDHWFGINCDTQCNCADEVEVCDKATGQCTSGCYPGFAGEGCLLATESGSHTRLVRNTMTSSSCHCMFPGSSECAKGCPLGCHYGWVGELCHIEVPSISQPPKLNYRTSNTLTLTWKRWRKPPDQGDGPVVAYFVQYTEVPALPDGVGSGISTETLRQRTDATRVVLTDLHNNTLYSIQLIPIHEQGFVGIGSPPLNVSTCGVPTTRVEDLEVQEEENSESEVTLTFTWKIPDVEHSGCVGIDSYAVYKREDPDEHFSLVEKVPVNRFRFSEVDPYKNLFIGVSIVNNEGFESELTVYSYIGKSGPVDNLVLTPSTHSVAVTWDPPDAANSPIRNYLVRYRQLAVADCDYTLQNWNRLIDVDANETRYVIEQLAPFNAYLVKLWARTEQHYKGQPISRNVTTLGTVPGAAVQNLVQTELTATRLSVQWEAPPCDTRHGRFLGYSVRLVHLQITPNTSTVLEERLLDVTSLTWSSRLVPHETYAVDVAFRNHVGDGLVSTLHVQMLQSTPSAPGQVHIADRSSSYLVLSWREPNPPHGVITKYEVKYWSPASVNAPQLQTLAAERTQFELEGLAPNSARLFMVRAFTAIGPGEWSAAIHAETKESLPSEPTELKNVSRGETSLTLAWNVPEIPNGKLITYHVSCLVPRARERYNPAIIEREVDSSELSVTISGLTAGTEYLCHVSASTRIGHGQPVTRTFFTLPQKPTVLKVPQVNYDEITDTTVTLVVPPTTFTMPNVETATIKNRLVVERKTIDTTKWRRRRQSEGEELPCGLRHEHLLDYSKATANGMPCYITAELDRLFEQLVFVIGDNNTYGDYVNVPLRIGQSYVIWQGLSVTVDGETRAIYVKMSTPVTAKARVEEIRKPPASSNASVIAGVVVAIITALLCVFVVIVLIIKRKRMLPNDYNMSRRTESERISSSPRASSHHEKSSSAEGYFQNTDSECEDLGSGEADPLTGSKTHAQSLQRPPINVDDLWNYVRCRKMYNSQAFKQEYEEIPMGLTAHCECAKKSENRNRNRYGNIIAYDHSRVKLEPLPDDPHSDYVNANYIDAYRRPGAWIATQGPSKPTLNDMWRMVWQERSHRIVMVTNLVEDGRHKCEQYWPDVGTRTYGDISVEKLEEEQYADFTIRTFNLNKGEETRIVRQFHFTSWPDHGCPVYATSLIAFRKKVRSYDDPMAGPTVVHCSAGVGRTGTFVALDFLLDMARAEKQVDVYGTVRYMRTKRVNMVQTQEQYEFVYEALLEALKSGDTAIPCVDFRKRYLDMTKENPETGKVYIAEEFELLCMLSTNPPSLAGCKCALEPENAAKNRNPDIIPLDNIQRPFLMTYIPGSSDYINAVFTDGYKHRDAYIITQMPLPHTVSDFWAMIFDHECSAIVMMNELDSSDPSSTCYYPVQAGKREFGPFTIETVALITDYPDITIRDLTLTMNKRASEPRCVRQFQFHGWPASQPVALRRNSLIQLLQLVEKWQQRSGNKTIVVHCMDGAARSGLLCAVSYMIERLKVEQEVDVFNSVKHTRINRPQLVSSLEQYQYIYEMAEEYMDCFETYANFK